MRRFLVILSAIAITASASATSPVGVVEDKSASLTLEASTMYGSTAATVCVARPQPSSSYAPGTITFTLRRDKPDSLQVELAARNLQDGRVCTDIYIGAETATQYTLQIMDRTQQEPWHLFYYGPLLHIPIEK